MASDQFISGWSTEALNLNVFACHVEINEAIAHVLDSTFTYPRHQLSRTAAKTLPVRTANSAPPGFMASRWPVNRANRANVHQPTETSPPRAPSTTGASSAASASPGTRVQSVKGAITDSTEILRMTDHQESAPHADVIPMEASPTRYLLPLRLQIVPMY